MAAAPEHYFQGQSVTALWPLQAITEFQSLMNQVQKSSSIIEKVVHAIANARIVQEPSNLDSRDIMDLQEFYEVMERHRMEVRYCVCHVLHFCFPWPGSSEAS